MKLKKRLLPAAALGIVAAAACVIITVMAQGGYGEAALYLSLAIGVVVFALAVDLTAPGRRPFAIIFSIYFLLFYLVPGLSHALTGRFPFYSLQYSPQNVRFAAALAAVFVTAVYVGYRLLGRQYGKSDIPRAPPLLHGNVTFGREAAVLICIALLAGSAIGWGALLTTRGDAMARGETVQAGRLMLEMLCRQSGFLAFLFALAGRQRAQAALLTAIAGAVYFATNYPLAIPRFMLAGQLLAIYILSVRFDLRGRLLFVLGIAVATFTLFPVLSFIARGDINELFTYGFVRSYFLTGDFDGFQSTINVVEYVDSVGVAYGRHIISALFFFVPRSVWASKSPGTGAEAAEHVGYSFTNISAPMPAELYVDFGVLGVIAGAVLIGVTMRKLDRLLFGVQVGFASMFSAAILFGYASILLRGSLVAVVGPVVLVIGLLNLVIWLRRIRLSFVKN